MRKTPVVLEKGESVESFGSKLSFADKIYDREQELQRLYKLYESVCNSSNDASRTLQSHHKKGEAQTIDRECLEEKGPVPMPFGEGNWNLEEGVPKDIQDFVASMLDKDISTSTKNWPVA